MAKRSTSVVQSEGSGYLAPVEQRTSLAQVTRVSLLGNTLIEKGWRHLESDEDDGASQRDARLAGPADHCGQISKPGDQAIMETL